MTSSAAIARRLYAAREARGLTLQDAADLAGIPLAEYRATGWQSASAPAANKLSGWNPCPPAGRHIPVTPGGLGSFRRTFGAAPSRVVNC